MMTSDPRNRDLLATAALQQRLQELVEHAAATGNQQTFDAVAAVVMALGATVEGIPGMVVAARKERDQLRAKPIGKTS